MFWKMNLIIKLIISHASSFYFLHSPVHFLPDINPLTHTEYIKHDYNYLSLISLFFPLDIKYIIWTLKTFGTFWCPPQRQRISYHRYLFLRCWKKMGIQESEPGVHWGPVGQSSTGWLWPFAPCIFVWSSGEAWLPASLSDSHPRARGDLIPCRSISSLSISKPWKVVFPPLRVPEIGNSFSFWH